MGDGCTGWFDGWWRHCCDAHDTAYANLEPRLWADFELAICVTQSGYDLPTRVISYGMGPIMFAGVVAFGWYFYNKAKKK